MLVLKALSLGPMHGYGIGQRIQQLAQDMLQVEEGTLYPALYRIENRGWIVGVWGMPPAEARKEAERRFGGVARIQEQSYELRSAGWIESFVQDVVYGSRLLRRTPGFTLAAVLTLALGIGASTAMFSILYSMLLRP